MGSRAESIGSLGLSFVGEDQGLTKTIEKVKGSTDRLTLSFKSMGTGLLSTSKVVVNSIGNMANRSKALLGGMARGIDGVVDKAMNPDMGYDSQLAEFNKTFSAMTVGLDANKQDIEKWRAAIVSTGYATSESMEDTAKSFIQAQQLGVDLEKALGTKGLQQTMNQLAKTVSVFGVDGGKLATTFAMLKAQFGVTEDQAKIMADRIFSIGKVFGAGRESIQQWPELVASLSKEFADMGRKANPKEIQQYAEAITTLGGAFSVGLGKPAEETMGLSREIFSTLAGEKRQIVDMFRGMGGEFGQLGNAMAEAGGDVDKMFNLIASDPLTFMKGLQKMSEQARANGGEMGVQFQRLQSEIAKTLGPDAAMLIRGNWDKVQASLKKVPDAVAKSGDAMKNAAQDAHKFVGSGDRMQMMLERFDKKMKSLVAKDLNAWFKNIQSGFHDTEKTMTRLASDKGPVGGLTRRLLLMRQVGISGLFTQTADGGGKAGKALGVVATQAVGALGAMNKLGIQLQHIPALLAAGGPVLLGMALFDKGLRKDLVGGVKAAADWLKKEGPGLLAKGVEGIRMVWDEVRPVISSVWSTIGKNAPQWSTEAAQAISSVDWGNLGSKLGGWLAEGATKIGEELFAFLGAVFNDDAKASTLAAALGGAVGKAAKGIWKGIVDGMWNEKGTLSDNLEGIGKAVAGALAVGLFMSSGLRSLLFKGLTSSVSGAFDGVVTIAQNAATRVNAALQKISWENIKSGATKVGRAIEQYVIGPRVMAGFNRLKTAADRALGRVAGSELWAKIKTNASTAWSTVAARGESAMARVGAAARRAAGSIKTAGKNMMGSFMSVLGVVAFVYTQMKEENKDFVKEWNNAGDDVATKGELVFNQLLIAAMKFVDQFTGGLIGDMIGGWGNMVARMRVYWKGFLLLVEDLMGDATNWIVKTWFEMVRSIKMALTDLGNWIQNFVTDYIVAPMAKGWGDMKIMFLEAFGAIIQTLDVGGQLLVKVWHGLLSALLEKLNEWVKKIPGVGEALSKELGSYIDDQKNAASAEIVDSETKLKIEELITKEKEKQTSYASSIATERQKQATDRAAKFDALSKPIEQQATFNAGAKADLERRKMQLAEEMESLEAVGREKEAAEKGEELKDVSAKLDDIQVKGTPDIKQVPDAIGPSTDILDGGSGGAPSGPGGQRLFSVDEKREVLAMARLEAMIRAQSAQIRAMGMRPIEVTTSLVLDGRKLTDSVTRHQNKGAEEQMGNIPR